MVISLTGFMGCGKSSTGKELARLLHTQVIDLDAEIVRRSNCTIPQIFERGGEQLFRETEFETLGRILEECNGDSDVILALGGGAITYEPTRKLVLDKTRCVYLRTSMDTIRKRIGESDPSRPLFKDATAAEKLYNSRIPIYEQAPIAVDTDERSPLEVAEAIIKKIG